MIIALTKNVYADNLKVYYSKIDDNGFSYITYEELIFFGNEHEKIEFLLNILFEEPLENMDYKLNDIDVINYFLIDDELVLNVTDDIKEYKGASNVVDITNQIIKTLISLDSVESITIYIDNAISDIDGIYLIKESFSN